MSVPNIKILIVQEQGGQGKSKYWGIILTISGSEAVTWTSFRKDLQHYAGHGHVDFLSSLHSPTSVSNNGGEYLYV